MADSWAEAWVMATVEMATEATNRAVRAEAVRAEDPLFQSMGVEETAMIGEVAAAATNATMDRMNTEMAAEIIVVEGQAEQATITGYNPLFRPIGAEEAAWAAVAKEEKTETMAGVTMEEPWIQMAAEDTTEAEGQKEAAKDTAEGEQEVEMEVTEAAIGGGQVEGRFGIRAECLILQFLFGHISKFDSYKFQNLEGKRARYYMV